ncbi:sensor histidine kinase [Gorillibacterium massiliense]|uniref:sensor histidine kinase n=1 Tax=Gorillibacterium massiliense TaxID=1280390 RepID=UPI0004BA7127|nr:sensor histidine kinase [Gorillibacterium massiliense]
MIRLIRLFFRKTNDLKIRNKLIFSFLFIVVVPVLIVGTYLTSELRQMALDSAINRASENVAKVKKQTEETLKVLNDISYILSYDKNLAEIVNKHYESAYDIVRDYRDYDIIRKYIQFYPELSSIRFYMDNPTLINNYEFIPLDAATAQKYWYQKGAEGKGKIVWYAIEDETNNNSVKLSLIRRVKFNQYFSFGILVIAVNPNVLNTIVAEEPFDTMIVDDNNYVIAANRQTLRNRTLEGIHFTQEEGQLKTGIYSGNVNGKLSKILVEDLQPSLSLNGLHIISIIPVANITSSAKAISWKGIGIILVSLFVGVILFYGFSQMLTRRIYIMSRQISRVSMGNLNTEVKVDGNDEIGQLSRQLNSMVISIRELMDEVNDSHRQNENLLVKQNEIKFKMMASQINPHFLFNALESIRMKAHIKGETEISKVVRTLGKLMRKNLEVGGRNITLKDELEMVRCYLEIQKFRYGDRLSYEIDVEPYAEKVSLPPLIIQPLVENSVIHGLENKEGTCTILVKAEMEGDLVHIHVTDNGAGMSAEKIEQIYEAINDPEDREGNRIGLRNVHQRLLLYYGGNNGLHIESELGVGTHIHFIIEAGREWNV